MGEVSVWEGCRGPGSENTAGGGDLAAGSGDRPCFPSGERQG